MKDIENQSLLHHNTFGIDVKCRRFVEFSSVAELRHAVRSLSPCDFPLLILGGGSNLLLCGDYPATVLHSAICGYEVSHCDGGVLLRVGSGEVWDDVVALCVDNGWYGMENLSAIPGEVGASAVQNIGAYGVEVKDIIDKVEAVEVSTGDIVAFTNADCCYAYRQSRFKRDWQGKYVITHVTYRLSKTFVPYVGYGNISAELAARGIAEPTARQMREMVTAIRNTKLPDPKVEGNAGSFFMNPIVPREDYLRLAAVYPDMPHYTLDDGSEKIPAGWMIDRCGWKGKTVGRAGVHSRQALVLVNRGGATGEEIVNLCNAVRADVKAKFGIDIHPEVNIK